MEDMIMISKKEQRRAEIMALLTEGAISQRKAADSKRAIYGNFPDLHKVQKDPEKHGIVKKLLRESGI